MLYIRVFTTMILDVMCVYVCVCVLCLLISITTDGGVSEEVLRSLFEQVLQRDSQLTHVAHPSIHIYITSRLSSRSSYRRHCLTFHVFLWVYIYTYIYIYG